MNRPTLYLMAGYPGAGKTTTAGIIAELPSAVHLASDKIRLELSPKPTFTQEEHDKLYQAIDRKTEELLKQGLSVIYDTNLNRYRHCQQKYAICERTKAQPVLIWLDTPKDIAKQRAVHEERAHLVPQNETPEAPLFERIASIIEKPRASKPVVRLVGQGIAKQKVKEELGL